MKHLFLLITLSLVVIILFPPDFRPADSSEKVRLIRTPDNGIQPQAATDERGVVHLIYLSGAASASDIFYVSRRPDEKDFSQPIRVNGLPGSAIATGTVRGAHLAIGKGNRVHVAWMGSDQAQPKAPGNAPPMLTARMNDARTAFEPQRNVIQFATGLDGGGSIAADRRGNVYVAWHGKGETPGEEHRRVWMARSTDEGKTFARETSVWSEPTGACGCCGMRAMADSAGNVLMLYRSATELVNRDIYLLSSKNRGDSFEGVRLHQWKINACPMSTAALAEGGNAVLAAWETEGQVYFAEADRVTFRTSTPVTAPGQPNNRRHPVVARNARGETILAWTEGTAWKKGGRVAWQVFDQRGNPTSVSGSADGVPVWSLAAVIVGADGSFTIIY